MRSTPAQLLQAPKSLSDEEKYEMPVSIAQMYDGEITTVSRYKDIVWDFYPYIPQENLKSCHKRIRWDMTLPDGRLLTDKVHECLLESAKDFIWSLHAVPIDGRVRPKMITLIAKYELLQPLLRWMVIKRLKRFKDANVHIRDFVPFAAKKNNSDDDVSPSTHAARLNIAEYIFYQRDKLQDAFTHHPWPEETALSLSGIKRGGRNRKPTTKYIPEDVAQKLARAAIDYVKCRSQQILKTSREMQLLPLSGNLLTKGEVDKRAEIAKNNGFSGTADYRSQWMDLRTACYITIDMFSGIRDSEMMSLSKNCISRTRSSDDTTDIYTLRGTIYKTGMRPKKWIVPPIVSHAVNVLAELTAHLRLKLDHEVDELCDRISLSANAADLSGTTTREMAKRLHNVRQIKDKLFLSQATKYGNTVSSVSTTVINHDLKVFCRRNNICDESGQPYPLHVHQFRRTYARFVARAELGDLLMLQEHFGHWSLDMTMYYADGALDGEEVDDELLDLVATEKITRQTEILTSHVNSESPVSTAGQWLQEWRTAVRTAPNKESLIAEYAETLTLNGTGHSWCVGNSRGNGCGGLCILEATMCVDCQYGLIGQEHKPVWTGIRDQQLEALALDDIGPGGKARAKEILLKAEKVLKRLSGAPNE